MVLPEPSKRDANADIFTTIKYGCYFAADDADEFINGQSKGECNDKNYKVCCALCFACLFVCFYVCARDGRTAIVMTSKQI
jgi:hypothetical protein